MAGTEEATTNTIDTLAEPTRLELQIPVTITEGATTSVVGTGGEPSQLEGLQVSGEAAATVEETSSSIDDMTKKLSQAGGSEIPLINGRASTSVEVWRRDHHSPRSPTKESHLSFLNQVRYSKSVISQL